MVACQEAGMDKIGFSGKDRIFFHLPSKNTYNRDQTHAAGEYKIRPWRTQGEYAPQAGDQPEVAPEKKIHGRTDKAVGLKHARERDQAKHASAKKDHVQDRGLKYPAQDQFSRGELLETGFLGPAQNKVVARVLPVALEMFQARTQPGQGQTQ